jgi:2-polyprenyl-6-methoxyphenol hydroxylase-like FAD-dependent oxidoreductase
MGDTETRAVVLGGSIAGLLAARVLADAYDDVVVVDRDVLIGIKDPRRGAPQGRHISGLLTGGQRALEKLYPGITQELFDDTVPNGDLAKDVRWYMRGYRLQPYDAGILTTGPSRPLLEWHIRERTQALPNVRFMERTDILGIEATPDRTVITGVRVQRLDGDAGEELIESDLVVDATGRGSRTPVWLENFGYPRVPEDRTKIGLGYVTQHYKLNSDPYQGDLSINVVAYPGNPRGCIFTNTDHDRIEMTTYGLLGDHPPLEQEALYKWMGTLGVPEYVDALRDAEPLDEPVAFRFPTTLRRRYEDMPRFPRGLLVTGDAVTCFNPVYAGGMTVAIKCAHVMSTHLHSGATPDATAYFRDLAKEVIDPAWEMANLVDLTFPGVEGERTLKIKVAQTFLKLVQIAATRDGKVTGAYMEAAGQVARPEDMQKPAMLLRILWGALRGPKRLPQIPVTRPLVRAADRTERRAA